jgi:nitrile hydratase subunit beta
MSDAQSKFKIGDAVMVAVENPGGNPRTPKYIRGKRGVVAFTHGRLENSRDHRGIHDPLYTVRFELSEVSGCRDTDAVLVDVHEEWLRETKRDS